MAGHRFRWRPSFWLNTYTKHMASKAWAEKRAHIFHLRGRACERCGSTDDLEVHHKTYDRLGNEADDDLCVLCEECHEKEHARLASRRHIEKEKHRTALTWTPPAPQRLRPKEKPQKQRQAKQESLF